MMRERILDVDVLTASRQRIQNIFANKIPIYMSFSGGKDSLVLAHLTLSLIEEGLIDKSLLRIEFIDEEAIFPCVERITMDWRDKFEAIGVPFLWYCVEVLHYSCLNQLENDESFICWDRDKADVWVRDPPPFAIRDHSALLPREVWGEYKHGKTYQEFLGRIKDGLHMTGMRASESVQRRTFMGKLSASGISFTQNSISPIYDWTDHDVWHYLREQAVDIPEAYLHLWQIGQNRRNMRISQFFSIDTAQSLARIAEFYPNLMERILRREPSAYIVSLYWDSEMFRRRTQTRRIIEQADPEIDYRQKLFDLFAHPPASTLRSQAAVLMLGKYQAMALKFGSMMTQSHCRTAYTALIAGDPKGRQLRALLTSIPSKDAHAAHAQIRALTAAPGDPRQSGAAR